MAWGNGGSSVYRMDYDGCKEAINSARDRGAGKPLTAGLRVFDRGTHLAVSYYNTDIVRYYPDGAIEIATGWRQQCTLEKIARLTGVRITMTALPLYNGRRTYPDRLLRISGYVFRGVNDYIRINSNGTIDPTTVCSEEVEVIARPKLMRPLRAKVKKIDTQLKLRAKFGAETFDFNVRAWLCDNLNKPLDEIDYTRAPSTLGHSGLSPMWFACAVGATARIEFKKFP